MLAVAAVRPATADAAAGRSLRLFLGRRALRMAEFLSGDSRCLLAIISTAAAA